MKFCKYESISNVSNINKNNILALNDLFDTDSFSNSNLLEMDKQSNEITFIATEKIDGTNFSINITKDEFQFASRNQFIDTKFYNIEEEFFKVFPSLVSDIQSKYDFSQYKQVILYGEFFGTNIQGRIKYNTLSFRFFSLVLINHLINHCSFYELERFLKQYGVIDYIVPTVMKGQLHELLRLSPEMKSKLCDDTLEGIVIEPYFNTKYTINHPVTELRFKHKGKKFTEIKHTNKSNSSLIAEFGNYLTEQRMFSVFSKSDYYFNTRFFIEEFKKDAYAEFLSNHPELDDNSVPLRTLFSPYQKYTYDLFIATRNKLPIFKNRDELEIF